MDRPSRRAVYEASLSGAQDRPFIPRLRSDPPTYHPLPRTLQEFRELEGRQTRKARLRELWLKLPTLDHSSADNDDGPSGDMIGGSASLTPEHARKVQRLYTQELVGTCHHSSHGDLSPGQIEWKEFKEYAEAKEAGTFPVLSPCAVTWTLNPLLLRAMANIP